MDRTNHPGSNDLTDSPRPTNGAGAALLPPQPELLEHRVTELERHLGTHLLTDDVRIPGRSVEFLLELVRRFNKELDTILERRASLRREFVLFLKKDLVELHASLAGAYADNELHALLATTVRDYARMLEKDDRLLDAQLLELVATAKNGGDSAARDDEEDNGANEDNEG